MESCTLTRIVNIVKHSNIRPKVFRQKTHRETIVGFYITRVAVAAVQTGLRKQF